MSILKQKHNFDDDNANLLIIGIKFKCCKTKYGLCCDIQHVVT